VAQLFSLGGMSTHQTFRITGSFKPRTLVVGILLFWAVLVVLFLSLHQPEAALIPLYGLYPGKFAEDLLGDHAHQIWICGSGLFFAALALLGLFRKSRVASIAFFALFCLGILGFICRFRF